MDVIPTARQHVPSDADTHELPSFIGEVTVELVGSLCVTLWPATVFWALLAFLERT